MPPPPAVAMAAAVTVLVASPPFLRRRRDRRCSVASRRRPARRPSPSAPPPRCRRPRRCRRTRSLRLRRRPFRGPTRPRRCRRSRLLSPPRPPSRPSSLAPIPRTVVMRPSRHSSTSTKYLRLRHSKRPRQPLKIVASDPTTSTGQSCSAIIGCSTSGGKRASRAGAGSKDTKTACTAANLTSAKSSAVR